MDVIKAIAAGLEKGGCAHEIEVDSVLRESALRPLNRMLTFAASLQR
ncbi:quinolinate synthetase [Erwinia tracheiphila PSU-1]|nr:quinolinate synthetase [Erwinia tracheiphila PSU-1]